MSTTPNRRKRITVVLAIVAVVVLAASAIFGRFGFTSVCSQCGAIRDTTEWQIPLTSVTIFSHSSEHASPVSTVLTSSGIIATHQHQWLFCQGSPMRTLTFLCLLSLLITGCVSSRSREDSFVSLHGRVEQTLAGWCDCGPVNRNEVVGGRFFEVAPLHSRCRILVSERKFFTQKEWEKQYAYATNQANDFMTMTNRTHTQAAQQVTGLMSLFSLPSWSYESIGVDVALQEPEMSYPGMEKESAEAQKYFDDIVRLLKPYHRANKSLQATRDGVSSSAIVEDVIRPACLSSGR
jgi:hypothetical protein